MRSHHMRPRRGRTRLPTETDAIRQLTEANARPLEVAIDSRWSMDPKFWQQRKHKRMEVACVKITVTIKSSLRDLVDMLLAEVHFLFWD